MNSELYKVLFVCFILGLFATYLLIDAYFNIKGTTFKKNVQKYVKELVSLLLQTRKGK